MKFINFLYANQVLEPADGDEDRVYAMPSYRGPNGTTAFAELSDEEIEFITKTRGIWVHVCSQEWAPMSLSALVPAFDYGFNEVQIYGELAARWREEDAWKSNGIIQYLDLSFMYITVPKERGLFIFKETDPRELDMSPDSIGLKFGDKVWDMTYMAQGDTINRKTGLYLFSEPLVVVGRLGELERLHGLKDIHPFLHDDMLILMKKPKPAPARIITLGK